jgi:hypothetical protein
MDDEIKEFAYLQENPTYQQDWDAAFWRFQEERENFSLTPEEIEIKKRGVITLEEIGQFVNSPRGFALAQRYGLFCAYYYGLPLKEQLQAINNVDLDKAIPNSIPIFDVWSLPRTVRVIPHAPARWHDPERLKRIRLGQIAEGLQPGHFLNRIDALMDKSPHLRDNQYLKVEIDITRTKKKIFADLRAILTYYRDQIGPVKQENKSLPEYDPFKVWKLVKSRLGRTPSEDQETTSLLWKIAKELEKDENAHDLWAEKRKMKNKEDSPIDRIFYGRLESAFQIARRTILKFTPSEK